MIKKIFLIFVLFLAFISGSIALTDYKPVIYVNEAAAQGLPDNGNIDETDFMFDLNAITHEKITGSSRQNWIRNGINYIFERIIGVLASTIGGVAVLIMSFGGFLILSSVGNEQQKEKGMTYIKYSLIGLAVTLGAYILVSAVQILIKSIYD
jgi:hypothetical protein